MTKLSLILMCLLVFVSFFTTWRLTNKMDQKEQRITTLTQERDYWEEQANIPCPEPEIIIKEVTIEVIKEVGVYQPQIITPFESGSQFAEMMREYSKGITVLSPNACIPVSQTLVERARLDGYDAETEIIENHCVVKAIIPDRGEIWLYDYVNGKCWLGWGGK